MNNPTHHLPKITGRVVRTHGMAFPRPLTAIPGQNKNPLASGALTKLHIARTVSDDLRRMLGYSIHPPFVGAVDGLHPLRLLEDR